MSGGGGARSGEYKVLLYFIETVLHQSVSAFWGPWFKVNT